MIKAIILDWGGVLIDDPVPGIIKYCSGYFKVPEDKFGKIVMKFYFDFSRGLITEDIFWENVCSELWVPKPSIPSLLSEAFRAVYSEKEEVLSIVSSLKNDRYKIALLSNTEVPMLNYFRQKKIWIFRYNCFLLCGGYGKT